MKTKTKLLAMFLSFTLLFTNMNYTTATKVTNTWPKCPKVAANSAIVMEVSTGTILYGKNINKQNHPASTTKLMTALLALENCPLNEMVTFSHDAVFNVEGSSIGIDVGENLTMENCLYGLMLESANEVAYAIAEHVGGSLDGFVYLMNKRAKELGCTETNFTNPHGLFDKNHKTSAHDLAIISREVLKYDSFRKINATKMYKIPATNKKPARTINNHHRMLPLSQHAYDGCFGGKTGYTDKSRYNLATFAKRGNMELICIILNEDIVSNQYIDTPKLLDYGFTHFTLSKVSQSGNSIVQLLPDIKLFEDDFLIPSSSPLQFTNEGNVVLPNAISPSQTTKQIKMYPASSLADGLNVIGQISYYYGAKKVGYTDITFNNSPSLKQKYAVSTVTTTEKPTNHHNKHLRSLIIFILFAIVLTLGFLYYTFIERPHRRKRKSFYRKRKRNKLNYSDDFFEIK